MELHKGARRPSEILKTLNGISPKTLTQRLRELEKWGLVTRQAYQEIPPRVDYALSDRGTDLIYVIEALRDLGESWQRGMDMKLAPHIKEQCSHCFEYRSATEGTTSVDNQ
jgi:DNA-binding HxlR family transcriptional regulator